MHIAHYLNTDNLSPARVTRACKSTLKPAYSLACFTSDPQTSKEHHLSLPLSSKGRGKKISETLYQDNISTYALQ